MALILSTEQMPEVKCWACGTEVEKDDPLILMIGEKERINIHPTCAHSIMRKLLSDLSELSSLGFEIDTS
jgi:hypothetical protein